MNTSLNFSDSFFSSSSDEFHSAVSDDDADPDMLLKDKLQSAFASHKKFLKIAHINAQSVLAHYSDLYSTFSDQQVDAILVSESWLKPSFSSTLCSLPGYHLLRNDRVGAGGGGVAIFLRANIPYRIISQSDSVYSASAEYLFLELCIHHSKILLGVYYSPSLRVDYFQSFEALLESLCPIYNETIILGDFNTCLLKNDSRSLRLCSIASSLNLHLLPLQPTHSPPNSAPTLLDLMIVSDPDKVTTFGQFCAPFSYHDLIYLSYKIRMPKPRVKFLELRNFKEIDSEKLRSDFGRIDWFILYDLNTIDEKVTYLNQTLNNLFDKHAPIRKVRVKHLPAPWLSQNIRNIMAKRDQAKRRYKKNHSIENLNKYKRLRNRSNRMCRDAKRRYFHESAESLKPAQLWKLLRTQGIGKCLNSCPVNLDSNALNSHFSTPPVIMEDHIKKTTLGELKNLPKPNCKPFSFLAITTCDIKKSILSITSKAVGDDKICIQMLRLLLDELAPILSHILNYSLETGSFPAAWKKAYVIPLPKTNNPTYLSEYRPISILPVLSKVLENLVYDQLSSYLFKNKLLTPFQSGFRTAHSTVTALLKVTEDIRLAKDRKQLCILTLLDFSSAFNSIDFDILLGILDSLNISPLVIAWFNSYLVGRMQCVRSDETSSDWCGLVAGVPQGGVLSPLLFSIFINSLAGRFSSYFHLYADDLQLYSFFDICDIGTAIDLINHDLVNISRWANAYGLLVNPTKSQVIIIGSRYMTDLLDRMTVPPVVYEGTIISYTNVVKNLGVLFDRNLSWTSHVNQISKKVHATVHSLRRLQNFLPIKTKVNLAQTLLFSLMDYADVCFLDATSELFSKIDRLQNLCIRFVYGLRKFDHVSKYRKDLKWLPSRFRLNVHILTLLYNILHNPSIPCYLRERYEYLYSRDKPLRPQTRLLLRTPPHHTQAFGNSFTVISIRLWNSLPSEIRESASIGMFKRRLREHYLSLC